jgi:hypothetical protein
MGAFGDRISWAWNLPVDMKGSIGCNSVKPLIKEVVQKGRSQRPSASSGATGGGCRRLAEERSPFSGDVLPSEQSTMTSSAFTVT